MVPLEQADCGGVTCPYMSESDEILGCTKILGEGFLRKFRGGREGTETKTKTNAGHSRQLPEHGELRSAADRPSYMQQPGKPVI